MKRTFAIDVRGKTKEWSFDFKDDDKYLQEWQDDGLHIMPVINSTPDWIFHLGLSNLWIGVQELLHFNGRD